MGVFILFLVVIFLGLLYIKLFEKEKVIVFKCNKGNFDLKMILLVEAF